MRGNVGRPIGSGFLLQLSTATLLITAAHVLDEMHRCTLHTIGKARIIPIEGTPYSTGPRSLEPRPDFGLDIGFVVLDEAAMQEPPACAKVEPKDLDLADLPAHSTAYGVVGMPEAENHAEGYVFDGKSYYYGGLPAPEGTYHWLGYNPATHFVMKFERGAMIDETSHLVEVPKPSGMSGGPAFRLGTFQELATRTARPQVIGVTTEWWESRDVLVAVRIALVVDSIRQLLPQYAQELPAPVHVQGTVIRPSLP